MPIFDDSNVVSCAGLAPVMALAERASLSGLIAGKVAITMTRVASAAVNPAGKLTSIIAGMAAGADSIDDLDVIRAGGMGRLFGEVYPRATLGQFLREFTLGHTVQLASVARAHLSTWSNTVVCFPGSAQAYVDIDSLLRPGLWTRQAGASFGHTEIAGKQVLRRGLSPLATTISTDQGAPVVQLWSGQPGGDGDEVLSECRCAGGRVFVAGQGSGGAE